MTLDTHIWWVKVNVRSECQRKLINELSNSVNLKWVANYLTGIKIRVNRRILSIIRFNNIPTYAECKRMYKISKRNISLSKNIINKTTNESYRNPHWSLLHSYKLLWRNVKGLPTNRITIWSIVHDPMGNPLSYSDDNE